MSLLTDQMVDVVMLDRVTTSDADGGFTSGWSDGATFKAAIVLNNSIEAQVAMKSGSIGNYTITTLRTINLQYHDVFKRLSDEKIFRVTSDGDDKHTPEMSSLDMRQVTAEEWQLN